MRVGEEQEEGYATKISHMLHMCGNTSVEFAGEKSGLAGKLLASTCSYEDHLLLIIVRNGSEISSKLYHLTSQCKFYIESLAIPPKTVASMRLHCDHFSRTYATKLKRMSTFQNF